MTTSKKSAPDPKVQPTMSVPEAGSFLGLRKAASYNAARRGEIPTITFGRRLLVPTARFRALLGIGVETAVEADVAA